MFCILLIPKKMYTVMKIKKNRPQDLRAVYPTFSNAEHRRREMNCSEKQYGKSWETRTGLRFESTKFR